MKKIILLLCFVTISFISNAQVTGYNVGDVVDDFTVTDTEGNEWNLYDITASGKYVYLDFFFDTCPPCQATTRIFNEFHDKYGCNEGDLFMMSVNNGTDTDAEVILFEQMYGGEFEHAPAISADGGSAVVDAAFGISAYPTYCMIGPDNTLLISDIWPLTGVETFEDTFSVPGIDPLVDPCTDMTMGVNDTNSAVNFAITPNPTTGNDLAVILQNTTEATIKIYDVLGKLMYTSSLSQVRTTLQPNLATGLYLVQVRAESGATVTQKLIVR